jgi:hypothetical protein
VYLHLGCDATVRQSDLVGVFDLDATTVSKLSRDYLTAAQGRGEIVPIGKDLPKSFVLTKRGDRCRVYLSPLGTATLLKRQNEIGARFGVRKEEERQ